MQIKEKKSAYVIAIAWYVSTNSQIIKWFSWYVSVCILCCEITLICKDFTWSMESSYNLHVPDYLRNFKSSDFLNEFERFDRENVMPLFTFACWNRELKNQQNTALPKSRNKVTNL